MTRVSDIMTCRVVTLKKDTTLREATEVLSRAGVSGAPVLDDDKDLVGILTERDIFHYASSKEEGLEVRSLSILGLPYEHLVRNEELCARYEALGDTQVGNVMSEEVVTVPPDATVETALVTMIRFGINRLPVVDEGKLVGIVTRQNLLLAFYREIRERCACPEG